MNKAMGKLKNYYMLVSQIKRLKHVTHTHIFGNETKLRPMHESFSGLV